MESNMKTLITGFFDFNQTRTFQEQIETAKKHNLDTICLRAFDKKKLFEISDQNLNDLIKSLKLNKMKVAIIDPQLSSYHLYNDYENQVALDQFRFIVNLADKVKATHLYLELPMIEDVIREFETIQKRLTPFIEIAQKSKKQLILKPNHNQKMATYVFLLNKMKYKELSVLFDPVYLLKNNEPTTTSYRLLKGKIGALRAIDCDKDFNPTLLGYGKTDILSIFKKLKRDNYKGIALIDNHFHEHVFEESDQKENLFSKLFKSRKRKKENTLTSLSLKLFPNEEIKDVTEDDILANQINFLRKYIFKI
jgi:sugar phosphate isomerase/epimerase